jgi:uncharacterized protein YqeY
MRADLEVAMRARDQVAVRALRTAVAAIANAEAPPASVDTRSSADEPVVGALVEHARLELGPEDVARVLAHEIADREDTIAQFDAHGRGDEAAELRAELAVLRRYA